MSRQPCRFFQKGYCRFGNQCKYAHVTQGDECDYQLAGTVSDFVNKSPDTLGNIIKKDLAALQRIQVRPALTAYGLGPHAINNLIEGRDMSPEELRLQYMEAVATNSLEQHNQDLLLRQRDMEYCIGEVTRNAKIAARYQQMGVNNSSNIRPFIKKPLEESMRDLASQNQTQSQNSAHFGTGFGQSGFGQSSALGATAVNPFKSSPFGTSGGFGSAGLNNAGGSTTFGQSNTSAFGNSFGAGNPGTVTGTNPDTRTSGFGQAGFGNTSSPFGNSGTPSGASGFGSAGFGQPAQSNAFGSSGFGQGTTQTKSAFGASNPVSAGSSAFGGTGFGGSSGNGGGFGNSGFGSSGFGGSGFGGSGVASSGFGSSGFGSSGFGSSGFGSSGTSNTNTTSANPFGQSSASAFGASTSNGTSGTSGTSTIPSTGASNVPSTLPSTGATGAFGSSSATPFGATNTQTTGFISSAPAQTSAFGQSAPTTSNFGQAPAPTSAFGQPPAATSAFGAQNTSSGFGSQIGAPKTGSPASASLEELDPRVKEAFMAASFELGAIPDMAPPPEVC